MVLYFLRLFIITVILFISCLENKQLNRYNELFNSSSCFFLFIHFLLFYVLIENIKVIEKYSYKLQHFITCFSHYGIIYMHNSSTSMLVLVDSVYWCMHVH